jgi:DnaK suppressor protein
MPQEELRSPAALASGWTRGPYWRALLEARWRERLQEVTELSLAYHSADPDGPDGHSADPDGHSADPDGHSADPAQHAAQRLLRRAVAARQGLADLEEALSRLAAGTFGYCEQCGSPVPAGLLAASPATRYCPRCASVKAPAPTPPAARARSCRGSSGCSLAPRRRGRRFTDQGQHNAPL